MTDSRDDTTEDGKFESDEAIKLYRGNAQQLFSRSEVSSYIEQQAKYYLDREEEKRHGVENLTGSGSETARLSVKSDQHRFEEIEGDRRQALSERVKDENKLRNLLGYVLLGIVGVQLVISDVFLYKFMCANPHSTSVMLAWLSACVIEVIGLVWVITRSIFPFNDGDRDTKAEDMSWPGRISQQTDVKTSQTIDSTED
ncbi:hypothetical protein [Bifidobacterium indicum]|uniref:hypothetical protein n=1 Tax=Bifidobacterium indicum TaxID=1691 RepID=UPI0030D9078B